MQNKNDDEINAIFGDGRKIAFDIFLLSGVKVSFFK
jgi:hypothetical protein